MRKQLTVILLLLLPILLCAQNDKIVFSHKGGVYVTAFPVALSCQNPSHHIRYTLNGSIPDANALLYSTPLQLNSSLVSSSDIYKISVTPEGNDFCPPKVMKAIVIRAAAFDASENRVSEVVTQSYFIKSLGCEIHDLPVISICSDSLSLFSYDTGIFVPGLFFDPENPNETGNYCQSGREWERCVNVEYYDAGNEGFNQLAGLRTHGGSVNRTAQQKGMKIYAREDYGKKNFKYKIFDELDLRKFKHLVLKPFRCAITSAGVQDWVASHIASNLNMATLASRPVVLFINGEYWGIYFLEEKGDERYLESHFGVDPDSVNIISAWAILENGTSESYYGLYYWLMLADLKDPEQYHYFSKQIDIPNFIDYTIFELFSGNVDWPINNVRCWQESDEPWHWFFYDGDCCFYRQDFDVYANITYDGEEIIYPTARWSTLFFRKLLENESFVKQFLSRLNAVRGGCLSYRNTEPYLKEITNRIRDEIQNQVERFHIPVSVSEWHQECGKIDEFLRDREEVFQEQTDRFFNLTNEIDQIVCYPNPMSGGQLNIKFSQNENMFGDISIYDLTGRCVFRDYFLKYGDKTVTIYPKLSQGVYVLRVGELSQKIVVM